MSSNVKVFAIRDIKAEVFATPFFSPTKGLALRSFVGLASDAESQVNKYPEDFTLYEIGEFSPLTGLLVPHSSPILIGTAKEYLPVSSS